MPTLFNLHFIGIINMTEILFFASNNPYLAFFLLYILGEVTIKLSYYLLDFLINRPMNAINIQKHGWPPEYCDVNGNFKEEDEE